MTWINKTDFRQVIKESGKCYIRSQWRYCPYWIAQFKVTDMPKPNQQVGRFRCSLFDKNKNTENSLPECNTQYGLTRRPTL